MSEVKTWKQLISQGQPVTYADRFSPLHEDIVTHGDVLKVESIIDGGDVDLLNDISVRYRDAEGQEQIRNLGDFIKYGRKLVQETSRGKTTTKYVEALIVKHDNVEYEFENTDFGSEIRTDLDVSDHLFAGFVGSLNSKVLKQMKK